MSHTSENEDLQPDGGYGWVVVVCTFLINAHTWGVNSSYGVFLADFIANNTYPGTSELAYSFVAGFSFSLAMFISPLTTYLVGRLGIRVTLLTGTAFEFLGLLTASFATKYYQLLLSQGVCFGIGMGFLYVGTAGVASQWFTKRRSLANGIGVGGSGFGGMVYSLSTNAMIKSYGVPWTFRMLAIAAGVVNLVCSLLMRDRNDHIRTNQSGLDFKLFRNKAFVIIQVYSLVSQLGWVILYYSLPHFGNSIGLNSDQGAIAGALLSLGQMFGRSLVGRLGDELGSINVTVVVTFVTGLLALVWWPFIHSFGNLTAYSLMNGFIAGAYWATIAPILAEIMGIQQLNASLSITFFALTPPLTFSNAIGLEIPQHTGSYLGTQLFTGFMYVAGASILLQLRFWKFGYERTDEVAGTASHIDGTDTMVSGGTLKSESEV